MYYVPPEHEMNIHASHDSIVYTTESLLPVTSRPQLQLTWWLQARKTRSPRPPCSCTAFVESTPGRIREHAHPTSLSTSKRIWQRRVNLTSSSSTRVRNVCSYCKNVVCASSASHLRLKVWSARAALRRCWAMITHARDALNRIIFNLAVLHACHAHVSSACAQFGSLE